MRVKHRIAAANGGDGGDQCVDAVQRHFRIGKRLVVGELMNLPSGLCFCGQP